MGYGGAYPDGYGGPDLIVTFEVAFDTDPGDTPDWTDLSDRLITCTINRGRQRELDTFSAGRAQIVLANEDRALDPTYATSPYYPNVLPMRRCRLRAHHDVYTYDVFNGYVDGWKQTYSPPQEALCEVSATDAFKVLANITLPPSVYAAEVTTDGPVAWWRFTEPSSASVAVDEIRGFALTKNGAPEFGAEGLVTRDGSGSVHFGHTTDGLQALLTPIAGGPTSAPVTGPPFSVEFIYQFETTGIADYAFIVGQSSDNAVLPSGFQVAIDQFSGEILFLGVLPGTGGAGPTSSVAVNDGAPHHIVCTWQADGDMFIYVDGVAVNASPVNQTWLPGHNVFSPGGILAFGSVTTSSFGLTLIQPCWADEFALYDHALTPARIAAHYDARKVGGEWGDDTSGERVERILDLVDWPASDRNIDTGVAELQPSDLGGTALSMLQKIELTEQGWLFVDAGGAVRFIARDSLLKDPYATAQATFGDSGSELEYAGLDYDYDDNLIYNEAQVSRADGTTQTASDLASQTKYLRRVRTVDGLLHDSDTTSLDLAHWIVNHYSEPLLRVTDLTIQPSAGDGADLFPQVLGREIGDRVTVRRRPQNLTPAIDQDANIEGITHNVTAVEWVTTWNLSPAETQVYWIVGVAGHTELGQTTKVAF